MLNEETGAPRRSLFLVDYLGRLRWRNPRYDWRSEEQYAAMVEAMLGLPMIPKTAGQ